MSDSRFDCLSAKKDRSTFGASGRSAGGSWTRTRTSGRSAGGSWTGASSAASSWTSEAIMAWSNDNIAGSSWTSASEAAAAWSNVSTAATSWTSASTATASWTDLCPKIVAKPEFTTWHRSAFESRVRSCPTSTPTSTPTTTPTSTPTSTHTLTINQSELTVIIRNIFNGVVTPRLEKTFNEVYQDKRNNVYNEMSNAVSHLKRIDQIVESAKKEQRSKILSLVSIDKRPIIDINVQVSPVSTGEVKFSLFGSDLRKYHIYLPKIQDKLTGRSFKPEIGTRHSRWYPHSMAQIMKNISLHLRMLDLYLKINRIVITNDYTSAEIGILGLEVPFVVPDKYEELFDVDELECDSNPIKKCSGIFVFGKNGVSEAIVEKIADQISKIAGFEHVYPHEIKNSEQMIEFINSMQTIAIGAWNRHARILIKQSSTKTVEIIDPWKCTIESEILDTFNHSTSTIDWNVIFVNRKIVDQSRGEGSCALVAFSRLLYLASTGVESYSNADYDVPIPDFYAFFASYLYRKNR